MRKLCRICNLLGVGVDGTVHLKMCNIFSAAEETPLATLMQDLVNIQISDNGQRSQYICFDCMQQVKIGHQIWKRIRDVELQPCPVITKNEKNRDGGSVELEFVRNTEIKPEQIPEGETKDDYLYEFLEDEFVTDDGNNSAVTTFTKDAERDSCSEDREYSEEDPTKLSLQRTMRKVQFEMPNPQVVLRIDDMPDHLVVEVKGDRCCGCSFVGENRRELLQHSTSAHSIEIEGTGNYCPICFYKFATENSLTRHIDACKSRSIFVCKNCEQYFNRQHQIEAHLQICKIAGISGEKVEEFVESTDGEYDSNAEFLLSESENESNVDSDENSKHRNNDWTVSMEQTEFSSGSAQSTSYPNFIKLSNVIDCHGVQPSSIPESQIVQRVTFQTFQYLRLTGERCCGCDFICSKRDQLFNHVQQLHVRKVNLSKEFICPICYQSYANEKELSKHINYFTSKDLLICSICDEVFCGIEALNHHQKKSVKHTQNLLQANQEKMLTTTEFNDEDVLKLFKAEVTDKIKAKTRTRSNRRSITKHRHLTMPDTQLIERIEEYENYKVITVTGERCCGCGQFFETYNELLQHGHQIHLIDNADAAGEYQCIVCFARFEFVRGLLLHQSSRKSVSKLFHCNICNLIFSKQFTMNRHIQTAHSIDHDPENNAQQIGLKQNQDIVETLPVNVRNKQSKINGKYVCCLPKCAKEFSSEDLLLDHCSTDHSGKRRENEAERSSESNVCPGCNKSFENTTCLVWHRFTRFTKHYQCRFCDQTFTRWSVYREHENTVHLGKTTEFPCETCGKVFRTAARLKAHLEIHSSLRKHVCSDCGASFRNKGVLKRHRRAVHSTEFLFDCNQCPKKFPTQEQLNAHSRVHSGAKPYNCRFCKRAFSHFTDRKRHEMSTHTGERPHQCIYCPAAYVRNRELIIHMQKHEVL
ncbi:zinc finger protein 84-like [Wyeomyia smithii]|uniref:zinc finger protein 84-like n=1 Tax=Wyeomyia smithii TaxID=174621 RepID=UPI002467BA30|nr:zinc finger protein 84-like [Wyeomyia smithii]